MVRPTAAILPSSTSVHLLSPGSIESRSNPARGKSEMLASYVRDLSNEPRDIVGDTNTYYLAAFPLRSGPRKVFYNGRLVFDGRTRPGAVHILTPNSGLRVIVKSPTERLNLLLPYQFLQDEMEFTANQVSAALHGRTYAPPDLNLGMLARALADEIELPWRNELYTDSLSTAILARLMEPARGTPSDSQTSQALCRWRMNRVCEYIDAHLSSSINLFDLANIAGLSRMHFAAQFRKASGLRPHEYLLKQRINRSKDLLLSADLSILDIAIAVGFSTQAHFATVFKRMVGETPARWRNLHKQ